MPRVSREQTEKNRAAIEMAAAKLFRKHGINGIGVADLMGAAGLTHGGFYGHFDSKDALAAVACEQAFLQSAVRWQQKIAAAKASGDNGNNAVSGFAAVAAGYLTEVHRDDPGDGCAMTALAVDVARETPEKAIHPVYNAGVRRLLGLLYDALPPATPDFTALQQNAAAAPREFCADDTRTAKAATQLAFLVGSMILARATAGDPLSDVFLATARTQTAAGAI